MTDVTSQKPMRVLNYGTAGPFLRLPASQLDAVKALLDQHKLFYWVEENMISWDGGPYFATIDFGRAADPEAVQAVLDSSR